MTNIIPFASRTPDHVILERLTVRESDGSLARKYFVSLAIDGGISFGEFDYLDHSEAYEAALGYFLPIVDKTGERA